MKYLLLLLLSFPAQAFYDPDIHFYYPDGENTYSPEPEERTEASKICFKPFGEGEPVFVAAPPQNGMWKEMDTSSTESDCIREFAKWDI